jgi:O-antigen/teichoic acid export membrane protein
MGIGLLVTVLVARHLGPREYGYLSYALSLIAFLAGFVYLGLNGLVIRDLVNSPAEKYSALGTTFVLKLAGSLLSYAVILIATTYGHASRAEFYVILLAGLSLLFRPFEAIDFWFHSQTRSKFSVYAKSAAFLVASSLNILSVYLHASVTVFALIASIEAALVALFLALYYHHDAESLLLWRSSLAKAKRLLSESWILILSGLLATVNLKIDQVMLRWMVGPSEVGVYSVAVNFSEVWYFLPTALALSVYPTLIDQKTRDGELYWRTVQRTLDLLFLIALLVAIAVTLVANPVITLLYGSAFSKAGPILSIHIWAGIFVFMRALFSKLILIEPDMLVFSLLTHAAGALVNVVLNIFLIPRYGGPGAAVSTLISYATSSYASLYLSARTRPIAQMMTKSLLLPARVLFNWQVVVRRLAPQGRDVG